MRKCYVYLIQSEQSKNNKPVKIGMAYDPISRMQELQVGNPYELAILTTLEFKNRTDASYAESFLHKRLKRLSLRGEWFANKNGKLIREVRKVMLKKTNLITSDDVRRSMQCNDYSVNKLWELERQVKALKAENGGLIRKNQQLMDEIEEYLDSIPVY